MIIFWTIPKSAVFPIIVVSKNKRYLEFILYGRAVVLESFFYRLGLVLDSLVFGLGLVSDLVIGLAKCSSWSRPSPAIYAFFLFQNKTIHLACLFRKRVM